MFGAFFLFALCITSCSSASFVNNSAVELFRSYLQINTSQPSPDYDSAVAFWEQQAEDLDLELTKYEYESGYPLLVLKWEGSNSSLPSIMLNSHMDVVAAVASEWLYPPFDAYMDDDGNIYARGTQDMKCVSMWQLEAIRSLKLNNVTLQRTVYMTLMPDEEIGGAYGMEPFVASEEFAAMNVGFELDEGVAYPLPQIPLMYADKTPWQFTVTCNGESAHASTMPAASTTAAAKCRSFIDNILDYRETQYSVMLRNSDEIDYAGTYTSINLTGMQGGTATNIIPSDLEVTFDMRLAVGTNQTEMEALLDQWVSAAGDNVTLTFILKNDVSPATAVDSTNPFMEPFMEALTSRNITVIPIVSPGTTDARFVRVKDIPAFGFSPMPNTTTLLHSANEYINAQTFLDGIETFVAVIESVGNFVG